MSADVEVMPPSNQKSSLSSPIATVTAARADALRTMDWIAAGIVFAAILTLRVLLIHALRWHSDEAQHMHVAWSWANGRLPYRDEFDNHSPLFGFLCSFPFRLVGERNDIVEAMRWFMLPLFGVCVWSLYRLGKITFSARVGLWVALVGVLYPNWFLKMAEFRTDVLWTTLWLVTLVILVSGKMRPARMFFAGLTLGAAFSVSMKSTLMLFTLASAGLVTWIFCAWVARPAGFAGSIKERLLLVLAGVAGLLIIPSAFVSFFAWHGLAKTMYYCVIEHNLAGAHSTGRMIRKLKEWHSLLIPLTIGLGFTLLPAFRRNPSQAARRFFLLCVAGLFSPILETIWTNVTSQDYLPVWPLYGGLVALVLVKLSDALEARAWGRGWAQVLPYAGLLAVILFEFRWIDLGGFRFRADPDDLPPQPLALTGDPNVSDMETIKEGRALTNPGEFLMDSKGETVYRPRPYWYVLETLTRKRLMNGMMPDDLQERLKATKTAVSAVSNRMLPEDRKFIEDNYISVGILSVLGKFVDEGPAGSYKFDITIPARYTLFTHGDARPEGMLDGVPFHGPVMLEAGPHEFVRTKGQGRLAVILDRAVEKGYSPFHIHAFHPLP